MCSTNFLKALCSLLFVVTLATNENYRLDDVVRSYDWLWHKGHYTEMLAVHPDYRPGQQNYEWNLKQKTFPRVAYAHNAKSVVDFVLKYWKSYMVCYSLNPRVNRPLSIKGYPRSHKEEEVQVSQNLLFDFDLKGKVEQTRYAELELFLEKTKSFYLDLGFQLPEKAFSGSGYHLLMAYPAIHVKNCLDLSQRIKRFMEDFRNEYKADLDRLEAKLDPSTSKLSQMLKCYGSKKTKGGELSRFYGGKRVSDKKLGEYLLQMKLPEPASENYLFTVNKDLPPLFIQLLEKDSNLKALWTGNGKTNGDTSSSGIDFTLTTKLLQLGFRNIDDISNILASRPGGGYEKRNNDMYLRRTLSAALLKY